MSTCLTRIEWPRKISSLKLKKVSAVAVVGLEYERETFSSCIYFLFGFL